MLIGHRHARPREIPRPSVFHGNGLRSANRRQPPTQNVDFRRDSSGQRSRRAIDLGKPRRAATSASGPCRPVRPAPLRQSPARRAMNAASSQSIASVGPDIHHPPRRRWRVKDRRRAESDCASAAARQIAARAGTAATAGDDDPRPQSGKLRGQQVRKSGKAGARPRQSILACISATIAVFGAVQPQQRRSARSESRRFVRQRPRNRRAQAPARPQRRPPTPDMETAAPGWLRRLGKDGVDPDVAEEPDRRLRHRKARCPAA